MSYSVSENTINVQVPTQITYHDKTAGDFTVDLATVAEQGGIGGLLSVGVTRLLSNSKPPMKDASEEDKRQAWGEALKERLGLIHSGQVYKARGASGGGPDKQTRQKVLRSHVREVLAETLWTKKSVDIATLNAKDVNHKIKDILGRDESDPILAEAKSRANKALSESSQDAGEDSLDDI